MLLAVRECEDSQLRLPRSSLPVHSYISYHSYVLSYYTWTPSSIHHLAKNFNLHLRDEREECPSDTHCVWWSSLMFLPSDAQPSLLWHCRVPVVSTCLLFLCHFVWRPSQCCCVMTFQSPIIHAHIHSFIIVLISYLLQLRSDLNILKFLVMKRTRRYP